MAALTSISWLLTPAAPRLPCSQFDPSLDWSIETEVQFAPGNNYQGAGLLLPTTNGAIFNGNSQQFTALRERGSVGSGNEAIDSVVAPRIVDRSRNQAPSIRVQKAGVNYTGSWSSNGVDWSTPVMVTQTTPWTQFGLFADPLSVCDNVRSILRQTLSIFTSPPTLIRSTLLPGWGSVDHNNDENNANNWSPKGGSRRSAGRYRRYWSWLSDISAPTNVGVLFLAGSTLNAASPLTVSNSVTWSGGVFER